MPIGKGYFWDGLSKGIGNLYGYMQNERMAGEAQQARAIEGEKDRAGGIARIKAAIGARPGTDTLGPDYGKVTAELDDVTRELEKHDQDIVGQSQNTEGWAATRAQILSRKSELEKAAAGMRGKVTGRHGVIPAAKPEDADAEFLKNLMK